jgi:thermitase
MSRLSAAALAVALWAGAGAASAAELPTAAGAGEPAEVEIDRDASGVRYVAGQLLVTYSDSTSGAEIRRLSAGIDAETAVGLAEIDARLLELPEIGALRPGDARRAALRAARLTLEATRGVESADLNYLLEPAAAFNDPLLGQQWGVHRVGLPAAWDMSLGAGTRIAIIDSGIDPNHPEFFGGKVVGVGEYFSLTPFDGFPEDNAGHGTHVAGIASANSDNGEGVAGASPRSGLIIQKVCEEIVTCSTAATAQALIDAADSGADVANLSLGGYNHVPALENAVNYATGHDVLVVAAAGNDARANPRYPAAYPNALAVASTNIGDGTSDFSNFGDWVDIAAPGGQLDNPDEQDILSTYPVLFGSYEYLEGTSMASPLVAGTGALLAAQGMGAAPIRARLESTATDLGFCGRDPLFGAGLLDASAATGATAPSASCSPSPGSDACEHAKLRLLRAKKALKKAKQAGDHAKIKRAKHRVKKWKKRVKKECGSL